MDTKMVVRAFLFNNDGQILLVRHRKNDLWVLPGGHTNTGESIHDAMRREIFEEFGMEARFFDVDSEEILRHRGKKLTHFPLPISIYSLEYKNAEWKDKSRIEYIFLMETDSVISTVQEEEIFEYRWFDPADILMMKPNIDTWDFYIEMLEKIIDPSDEM